MLRNYEWKNSYKIDLGTDTIIVLGQDPLNVSIIIYMYVTSDSFSILCGNKNKLPGK